MIFGRARAFGAQLQPETAKAYERYVRAAEARMKLEPGQPAPFLYIDSLPAADQGKIRADLGQGDIFVTVLTTLDQKGKPISAPDGWIHHWLAAMYIPGATLKQAVAVDQDYDKYSTYYKPEMVRSHLLERRDNTFKVYARLQKKTPWLTFTLDIYNDVHYVFIDSQHLYTVSHAFRIQQVESAGLPGERLDPPDDGSGILWALDIYWRYEAIPGGMLVESETIGLSRTLPFGLGWIIKPFVRRSALATDRQLMMRTRQIIEQEAKNQAGSSGRK